MLSRVRWWGARGRWGAFWPQLALRREVRRREHQPLVLHVALLYGFT